MKSWKPYRTFSAGLFLVSVLWVLAGLPLSPAGAWAEIRAPEPAWVMGARMVSPLIAFIGLALAVSCLDKAARTARVLRAGAPWLLLLLSFWTLRSAAHLRQEGPVLTNYFYFTGTIGPGAFVGQAMNLENAGAYLRGFPEIGASHWGQQGGTRVISNPPGATMLIYGCRRLLEAWPWLQESYARVGGESGPPAPATPPEARRAYLHYALVMFVPDVFFLLIALGMPPLWWLAHALLPEDRAPFAAVTAALVPGLFVFSFTKDAFQVSLALWFWWALYRAVRDQSLAWALGAGLALFLGLQFSLAFVTVAAIGAGAALLAQHTRGEAISSLRGRGLPRLVVAALAGLVVPALALWVVIGYEPWKALLAAYRGHGQYVREFGQSYRVWVWLNLVHLVLFMGAPAAASWLASLWCQIRTGLRERSFRALDPYFLSVTGLLLLLNLSGKNLSEVPRLWLFFMPALYLTAERVRAGTARDAEPKWLGAALLTLQVAQLSVFVLCFSPLGAWRPLTEVFPSAP